MDKDLGYWLAAFRRELPESEFNVALVGEGPERRLRVKHLASQKVYFLLSLSDMPATFPDDMVVQMLVLDQVR